MSQKPTEAGSQELVSFLGQYGLLLEKQLEEVKTTLSKSFNHVMTGVNSLSQATAAKKKEAESAIESVYVNPDQETAKLVGEVQSSVDSIFETAKSSQSPQQKTENGSGELSSTMSRLQAKFSDKIQGVTKFEQDLHSLLYEMVGSLSADDVVAQRISHVSACLRAMQLGLANIMVDYPHRCSQEDIQKFASDLLRFTTGVYTMSAERKLLLEHFKLEGSA